MHILWPICFINFLISTSLAILVNITIDDTHGDAETGVTITYIPPNEWKVGTNCTECSSTARLDPTFIHDGTWHDGTSNTNPNSSTSPLLASVPFYGSAVYVYCIIPDTTSAPNGYTDMTFLIDSQPVGSYIRTPARTDGFQYDALVFASQSIPHGNHTLTIQNGRIGGQPSLVLLDYIIYTYENGVQGRTGSHHPSSTIAAVATTTPVPADRDPSPPPPNKSGKIVGGVLGSLGVVLLGLVAFLWKRQRKSSASIDLFRSETPPSKPLSPPILPAIQSVSWIQMWRRRTNTTSTMSRFSFNPSIFAGPVMEQRRNTNTPLPTTLPPPVTTVLPRQPPPPQPNPSYPLQPNRERSPPPPQVNPRNEPSNPLSIREWQKRTQLEAEAVPPRLDVSEADLSSYYEFSSDNPESVPPPARPGPRRFTVVNN